MSGLRSRKAWASPWALAVTPGPSVERTAPGAHPVQGLADIGLRVGVGEPEIAFTVLPEGRAAENGHAPFLQNGLGDLRGGPLERFDIREDVEGALGRPAGHAGEGVEPGHD